MQPHSVLDAEAYAQVGVESDDGDWADLVRIVCLQVDGFEVNGIRLIVITPPLKRYKACRSVIYMRCNISEIGSKLPVPLLFAPLGMQKDGRLDAQVCRNLDAHRCFGFVKRAVEFRVCTVPVMDQYHGSPPEIATVLV